MTIKFYNSNDSFGDGGPFEAESKEDLAERMESTFREWADAEYYEENGYTLEEWIEEKKAEYIKGLTAEYHGEPRIIFDNGGGITLQLPGYTHSYDAGSIEQCADDLSEWISDEDTSGWDGNEEEAVFDPTVEDISSGGYRVETVDAFMSLPLCEVRDSAWGNNVRDLYAALTKKVLA